MSTKIYNGHEIVGHTLESFLAAVQAWRALFERKASDLARAFVVQHAVRSFDKIQLGLKQPTKPDLLFTAQMALLDRQTEVIATKKRDTAVDFGMTVVLFPINSRLLAIPFIENRELAELWRKQAWWREFGYWNNTDRPDNVSDSQWDEREALWEKVLGPDCRSPAEKGYSVTVVAEHFGGMCHIPDESVTTYLPSLEQRAKAIAFEVYLDKRQKAGEDIPQELSELVYLSLSDDVATVASQLVEQLDPNLTAAMLKRVESKESARKSS